MALENKWWRKFVDIGKKSESAPFRLTARE